jgi:hypothetical protein
LQVQWPAGRASAPTHRVGTTADSEEITTLRSSLWRSRPEGLKMLIWAGNRLISGPRLGSGGRRRGGSSARFEEHVGGDGRGQPVETFAEWERCFRPVLGACLAALDHCDETCARQWAPALVSDADQLHEASASVERWSSDNQCPQPDLDIALAQMARSYRNAATMLEALGKRGSLSTWLTINRELRGLHATVAKVLAMLYQQTYSPLPAR